MSETYTTLPAEASLLRQLARRVRQIADSPENLARKERWLKHNALQAGAPMVLSEMFGLRVNSESPTQPMLQCQEPWARKIEEQFRDAIYHFEVIGDDWVVEPWFNCNWKVDTGNFGVRAEKHTGSADGKLGSYVWEAPLKNLKEDLGKLQKRKYSVDREGTLAWKSHIDGVFGDILPTRLRGAYWWTAGLTQTAIELVGLEQLMLYMVDEPEGLHRLMAFLRDDMLELSSWLEREGLLSLNNENDYVGSGSIGYTHELPAPGRNGNVRTKDMWVLSESQETVGVGPEMFAEFIFPYQREVTSRYGLSYYGCCEPVHSRWHVIRQMENLRKVSISPWCDQEKMASALGNKYVFCRKPNPALVSTDHFDEAAIRADLRQTLDITRKCGNVLEVVLKDVHTVNRRPERLARWVQIAKEEIASQGVRI